MKNLKLTALNGDKDKHTVVTVGNVKIGEDFVVIAGPCSVESEEQIIKTAQKVKEAGANMLRGGAFKPRTSPYSFQGLGLQGLKILERAKQETGLPVVTLGMCPGYANMQTSYRSAPETCRISPSLKKLERLTSPYF